MSYTGSRRRKSNIANVVEKLDHIQRKFVPNKSMDPYISISILLIIWLLDKVVRATLNTRDGANNHGR